MNNKIDFDQLAEDVLSLLQKHGLNTERFGINLAISGCEFDALVMNYPNHRPEMLLLRSKGEESPQWFIQITRLRAPEDFPPGIIITPPNDGAT